jgi:hypothetical protein
MTTPGAQIGPALDYENPATTRELRIEQTLDGGVAITVPTRRSAWRFIRSFADAELLAILAAPLLWLIFKLFASKRPRAFLRITPSELIVNEWSDDGLGYEFSSRTWPLIQIGELRRNRYDRGLWMTITGKDSFSLLLDVPEDELEQMAEALAQARGRVSR